MDLKVISTRGRSRSAAILLGSVTEGVIVLTEFIVPATDTPGAKAAKYIDLMLHDVASEDRGWIRALIRKTSKLKTRKKGYDKERLRHRWAPCCRAGPQHGHVPGGGLGCSPAACPASWTSMNRAVRRSASRVPCAATPPDGDSGRRERPVQHLECHIRLERPQPIDQGCGPPRRCGPRGCVLAAPQRRPQQMIGRPRLRSNRRRPARPPSRCDHRRVARRTRVPFDLSYADFGDSLGVWAARSNRYV